MKMKRKPFRRALTAVLSLSMILALMPVSALASTTVTPSPNTGNSSVNSLEVEYFSSTLYNWDESAANAATAEADTLDSTNVVGISLTSGYYPYLNYYGTNGFGGWSAGAGDDVGSTFGIVSADDMDTYLSTDEIVSGSQYYIYNFRAAAYLLGSVTTDRSNTTASLSTSDTGTLWTITLNSSGYYTISASFNNTTYYITWGGGNNADATLSTSSTNLTLVDATYGSNVEGKGFYFTASGNKGDSVPSFSEWSGTSQNYMIYSGLAASTLSESSNAPFNDDTVNAANLFATDGSNTSYTSVYTDVQVPFVYDSETGYYTLDSDSYGVYFANGTASSGATMSIADLPMGYYAYAGTNYYKCGFAPFNTPSSTTASGYEKATGGASNTTTVYPIAESMVYGFGMVTSVDFQMTDDGQIDGEDIQFEFSGDDDVWVYIDGVLVLDIGGTHDAIKGTINFRTGDVTLTAENYSYIGDKATGTVYDTNTMSQTNLYTALDTTLTGFSSEGTHTMTIYYMDRGQGRTNCLIKFNLPQEDSLSVTKEIGNYYLDGETYEEITNEEIDEDVMTNLSNIDFSFTLYNGGSTVANENYSLYDADGNFVQTGSTDSSGQFTLKNGYTAVFNNVDLDEEGSWYVVENLSSSRWVTTSSYTATINSSITSGTGDATSSTVALTGNYIGSNLSADSIAYTFTNKYVKGADPDVDVYDETIVLDYGLPVEVDVTANDVITLYGKTISEIYNPEYSLTLNDADEDTGIYKGTYGYAKVVDGKIVYTLTEDFCGIETVKYTYGVTVDLEVVNDDGSTTIVSTPGSATGTLTIIPATSVYYEEDFSYTGEGTTFTSSNTSDWNKNSNFITIATGNDSKTASFSVEGNNSEYGTYQETGLVGTTTDSTYGTDAIYLDNLCDSYGTSLKVDTSECSAQYKYTFTGMGTTIYGRVSPTTGYIRVTVTDSNGTVQDTQYIDTINLVTKTTDGSSTILDETLYNIPIYQNTALANYDTYTVRIYVYAEETPTDAGESGGEFYLDGVRVYNPMGSSTEDNTGYETANSAYATDGEANMAVINIRQKVVSDYDEEEEDGGYTAGNALFTLTDVNGEIEDFSNYNSIGPNEEFYLDGEGYTLSFALVNWSSTNYKLYLGMKAPNGSATSATFNTYAEDEDDTSSVMGTIPVNNSSDCYYDISSYVDVHTITVYEDDEDEGTEVTVGFVTITSSSNNLLALTNIKVTGTSKFDLGYSEDIEGGNEDDDGTTPTLYAVSTAYAASLFAEEEEEEVSVFEPESISVSCSYSSKTRKSTVTIVTSKDVSYVTINGTKITGTSTSGGKMKFSKTYTKVTKGTEYEVIAYDSNGVASASYTATAQ